uniref:Uncharacterized protein n=1 Tax=Nelumbo nucifera TaxID=4432 RepID=A0A822XHA3_NELNU|nr:TPA_asm: hypothetical protein HUJ06_019964 [Nelumbo nucifera]
MFQVMILRFFQREEMLFSERWDFDILGQLLSKCQLRFPKLGKGGNVNCILV